MRSFADNSGRNWTAFRIAGVHRMTLVSFVPITVDATCCRLVSCRFRSLRSWQWDFSKRDYFRRQQVALQ
jgi:hypothetical protein